MAHHLPNHRLGDLVGYGPQPNEVVELVLSALIPNASCTGHH